jgi:gamma-glutamylputrescine oxidase
MTPRIKIIPPCWSADSVHQPVPFPGGSQRFDVAVIGGGFAGLSAAYHILRRRPGARLAVLEARQLGAGASGRTTGMLSPGVGQNLVALTRRIGPESARVLYQETLRAVSAVASLVDEEGIDCELEMSGQMVVARSPDGRRRLQEQALLMQALSLPVEVLDDEELQRRVRLHPLRQSYAATAPGPAALRFSTAGILHPLKLVRGLYDRVRARGGVVYEGSKVQKLVRPRRPAAPVRLCLDGGEVLADQVVVATAGYTPELGLLRGRLLPVHLQVLLTEPLDDATMQCIGWRGREGILDARRLFSYFRLTADRRIVFGGGRPRYAWGGSQPTESSATRALCALATQLERTFPTEARLAIAGGWTGVIGYVLDALPAIARLPDCSRIVHAVGWCGHGVALATASGRWIAEILCDGATAQDLPWFRASIPLVPTELARWVGFRAQVGLMDLLDRLR